VTEPPPPPPPPPSSFGTPPPGSSPDVGAALSYGWKKFGENPGAWIAIIVAPFVIVAILDIIGFLVVRGFFGALFFTALAIVVANVAYLGIFNAALMTTAGQSVDLGKAFSSDRMGEWIAFSLVYGLLLGIGGLFCGIGALVVVAFFGLAPFYFIDQRKSLGEALSASLDATRANPGVPLALAITALVAYAGFILCFVGALVTTPLAIIAAASIYRRINNQDLAP
jgi:uncharacterized membrane protein